MSKQVPWKDAIWTDDITKPLPPGWQEAVEIFADRIKESIDEEILNQVIEESK